MSKLPKGRGGEGSERRLRVLLEAYLDDAISEAGLAEMERLLAAEPALRRVFVEVGLQDQMSHRLFRADDVLEMVSPGDTIEADDSASGVELDRSVMAELVEDALRARRLQEAELERSRELYLAGEKDRQLAARRAQALRAKQGAKPLPVPSWVVWGSVAALLFLAAGLFAALTNNPEPSGDREHGLAQGDDPMPSVSAEPFNVAFVRDSVGARWASTNARRYYFQAGQPVTLESGLAEVVFGDGTTVVFEGPVTFEPTSPKGLRLVSGRLTARVPDGVTGFQVATAGGLVTDHGTEFGVFVDGADRTFAQTFSGLVTLAPPDGSGGWRSEAAVDLRAGDAATSHATGVVRRAEPDALAFVRAGEFDAHRDAADSPYARWLAYGYGLRRDADVVAYYVFDQDDVAAGALVNRAAGGVVADDGRLGNGGEVAAPRWVEGRFGATRSLRFGDAGDGRTFGVVVPDSDALDLDGAMTFALWVRADDPALLHGTLLSKRDVPPSRMNYQVSIMPSWQAGGAELQFGAGRDDASVRGFAYSPASGRLSQGAWHHVVFTTDGQTIRYYIDSELVHTALQTLPPLTNNADLLIGTSAAGGGVDFFDRAIPFLGDISEVLIAKRAFNETEIQALYDNSRATP